MLERREVIRIVILKESAPAYILQAFVHTLVIASFAGRSKVCATESRLWMDEIFQVFLTKVLYVAAILYHFHVSFSCVC